MCKYFASRELCQLYIYVIIVVMFQCVSFSVLADEKFIVSTSADQLVTLQVENASLKAVVEHIASELNIELEATNISNDIKVTDDFDRLPLERALQRLGSNFITVTEEKGGKVAKIFLLPQGKAATGIVTESRPPAYPAPTPTAQSRAQQPQGGSKTAASESIGQEVTTNEDTPAAEHESQSDTTKAKARP